VYRSIGGLCGEVLVQRIPGDALYEMTVLSNLANANSCSMSACPHMDSLRFIPVEVLYILAILSMLPDKIKVPSGDHARSYISEPIDLHMCFTLHVSLSPSPSSPNAPCSWFSEGTHIKMLPSSPALASVSPLGAHLTTLTVDECLLSVDK
jgi:hypothetical protein